MSSGCYFLSHNDVLAINGKKINFQVCNIFRSRSRDSSFPELIKRDTDLHD